jgi:nucleotide-binding universal stress UspA family protein
MTPTFIAGFDGSDGSRAALHFAARLAEAVQAEITVVNGADDSQPGAEQALEAMQEATVTRRMVRNGKGAQALIEAADELSAALIIVGAHEGKGMERLKLGSTAERVVHGAPCPVAIVPHSVGAGHPKTIAVAYDGREPAQTALAYAAALARTLSARLALIAVAEPLAGGRWEGNGTDSRIQSPIVDHADTAAAALRPEFEVEVRTEVADPREAILAACTDDVDLLVMGSRAYGPLHATLVGSVSKHVAAHSRCPVIVVPRQMQQVDAIVAGASSGATG